MFECVWRYYLFFVCVCVCVCVINYTSLCVCVCVCVCVCLLTNSVCVLGQKRTKSFLKVERDAPALVVRGSSFHQRGTTNENSLDCRACTDGSAKRRSLDERSVLGVTFALTRAFR